MRPYGCRGEPRAPAGPLAPDLTRATTFAYASAEELRAVGAGEADGEFYPRYGHPAARTFESAVAGLESTDGAVSFASGMATLHALLCAPLGEGAVSVVARDVYGGTSALVAEDLPRFGIEVRRFDPLSPGDLERVLDDDVRLVHVETPTNPLCRVVDVARTAAAAHACGALLSVDATFAPPPLQRVGSLGADLVLHSATKFLGGHSDALGGVVAGAHAHLEPLEGFRRRTGGVLAPDTAWLLVRSLKTLPLRVLAASDSAARLARFLDGKVKRVSYPGLAHHPDHDLAQRQMTGHGSLLAFEVKGGLAGATRVYDRFEVISRAVSLGGTETTALLPLHSSHAMVPANERARAGIGDGTIRLSVGLEPYEALERDLARALAGC
ncbi:MAG: trans-sulfuration enzyme family protein [Planctomycetota bacterium]|jgi:cystathionine beta-lyase/cystathionine gamma-synthase